MAKQQYVRSAHDLPAVDVPDWQLVQQIVDLLRPYARGGEDPDFYAIEARDERGAYSDAEIDAVKTEMARRGQPPSSIQVRVRGWEREAGTSRELSVTMYNDWRSDALFASGDEAIVAHSYERTRALMEQAASRRGASGAQSAQGASARDAAPDSTVSTGWRRWARDPNPWALYTVTGIIAAIVAGIVLAIILH